MQMQQIEQPTEGAAQRMRRIRLEPAPVRNDRAAAIGSRT
jgi:hypothetical protein